MVTIAESLIIDGVFHVRPVVHGDERGYFVEPYRRSWFPGGREMIQMNRVHRQAGALAGLHYHRHQADYWYVIDGLARVVLHDFRDGSPTYGATSSFTLGHIAPEHPQLCNDAVYIPPGVAHGFAALTDVTLTYLVDGYYDQNDELGIHWDDPDVAGDWQIEEPILSARDSMNPYRADIDDCLRPYWPMRT